MNTHTLPNTIEELEELLYALTDGKEVDNKRLLNTLQSSKFHLEQWYKTYGNGGNCDYIISMDKSRFRQYYETIGGC